MTADRYHQVKCMDWVYLSCIPCRGICQRKRPSKMHLVCAPCIWLRDTASKGRLRCVNAVKMKMRVWMACLRQVHTIVCPFLFYIPLQKKASRIPTLSVCTGSDFLVCLGFGCLVAGASTIMACSSHPGHHPRLYRTVPGFIHMARLSRCPCMHTASFCSGVSNRQPKSHILSRKSRTSLAKTTAVFGFCRNTRLTLSRSRSYINGSIRRALFS